MTHPIQGVLDAEKEAARIIEKTEKKRLAVLTKEKQEAITILAQAQKKTDVQQQKRIDEAKEDLHDKSSKIRDNAQTDVSKLRKSAEKKLDKACDFILASLEKKIE